MGESGEGAELRLDARTGGAALDEFAVSRRHGRWSRKTFKRELGVVALVFWSVITVRIFWYLSPDHIRALDGAYGMLSTTIWLYAAAAFGMDSLSKQIQDPTRRWRMDYSVRDETTFSRFPSSRPPPIPGRSPLPGGVDRDTVPPPGYG